MSFVKDNAIEEITDRYIVGDFKMIELYTGEIVKMVILDFSADKLSEGGFAKLTLGIFGIEGRYSHLFGEGIGWEKCLMRTEILPRFLTLIPKCIRDEIKPVRKINGTFSETEDKLFLFSAEEVYKKDASYRYFGNGQSVGVLSNSWLRSQNNTQRWHHVTYFHDLGEAVPTNAYLVRFGFCV